MLSIVDARTNLKVVPGVTVHYPAGTFDDSWTLTAVSEDDGEACVVWRLADGTHRQARLPIFGFWIFRYATLDATSPGEPPEDPLEEKS